MPYRFAEKTMSFFFRNSMGPETPGFFSLLKACSLFSGRINDPNSIGEKKQAHGKAGTVFCRPMQVDGGQRPQTGHYWLFLKILLKNMVQ
jgi:hypothetical protein